MLGDTATVNRCRRGWRASKAFIMHVWLDLLAFGGIWCEEMMFKRVENVDGPFENVQWIQHLAIPKQGLEELWAGCSWWRVSDVYWIALTRTCACLALVRKRLRFDCFWWSLLRRFCPFSFPSEVKGVASVRPGILPVAPPLARHAQ
jgi:hypothetical protein